LPNFNERTLRNSEATFDDLIAKATPLENIIDKSKHDQVINTVKLFAEERTKKAIKGKEGWLNFLAGGEINGYSLSNNPRKFVLELARNRANKEQKLDGYNIPQAFVADYLKKKGMDYEAQSYLSEYKKFSSGNEAAKAMGNDNQLTQKTGSSLKM
jgi:hypothetical protein